ncbi:hypothetical protein B0T22DRAFT_457466 [Podospora appendiculata]|uniref:Uncharacterized protein n=1 Tax=Podospora appendiculata TaxID=314037 RepID=A0AAE0X7K5_9PEZI|nr:hypothetical protein B0T22DRAFT_457466 [Podospora appendiculata]
MGWNGTGQGNGLGPRTGQDATAKALAAAAAAEIWDLLYLVSFSFSRLDGYMTIKHDNTNGANRGGTPFFFPLCFLVSLFGVSLGMSGGFPFWYYSSLFGFYQSLHISGTQAYFSKTPLYPIQVPKSLHST